MNERKTNNWVLEQNFVCMKKSENSYFGHILMKDRCYLEKEILQCTTSGHWRREKLRTHWEDNITKEDHLLRSIEDRTRWRIIYMKQIKNG